LDKALHSAGFDLGFIILGTNLTNPLNMLLPVLQTVSKKLVMYICKDAALLSGKLSKGKLCFSPIN